MFKKDERIKKIEQIDNYEEYEIKTPNYLKLNTLTTIQFKKRLMESKNRTIGTKCQDVTYLVTAKKMILNSGITKICDGSGQFSFYATILHSPISDIILYYFNEKNEFHVQTKSAKIDKLYNNIVDYYYSKNILFEFSRTL